MADTVLYEVRDGVARVTLNRPEKRNALDPQTRDALAECAERVDASPQVRVMILTGAGRAFCSGMDLQAFSSGERSRSGPGGASFPSLPNRKPTIAAVNGPAVAGGFELVLGCDLAVAAEEAVFGLSEVQVGLFAAGGGVFRLPRIAGMRPAMEMLLTGQRIDASRALELGIVNHVVPVDRVLPLAEEIAGKIAAASPLGVTETLTMARRALDMPEEDLWHLNREAWARVSSSEDALEGARAFVEKRAPRWRGR
jgi:enoyl-CoA hydratase/carnithine racemase